jgi:hypothetical protein
MRQAPRRSRLRPWWAAGVAALVAICAASLWLVGQALGVARSGPSATPTPAVAYPTPEPPALIAAAERRPLPSTIGRSTAVRDYLGRPVMLVFYAEST